MHGGTGLIRSLGIAAYQIGQTHVVIADAARARVRRLRTEELTGHEVAAIREVLEAAFANGEAGFSDDDWRHAVGGIHFVLDLDGEIVAHASVVERVLHVGGRPLRTGYVEAVTAAPAHQRKGLGAQVMREVTAHIRDRFELGALGTGSHRFYERLGWLTWQGPTSVRAATGQRRTPEEDGYVMVLPTPSSPRLDPSAPISCDWREGDVW